MASNKKKESVITSLGKDGNYMVQKSRPLLALWDSNFSLPEFKILDVYLSRIDSHNPEKKTVVFTKGELEELLGVTKINKTDLDTRLDNLMRRVEIPDNETEEGYIKVVLFEKAHIKADKYGINQVELMCTDSAMKYFFNVDNIGYLRYKLRCIVGIRSLYTYIMFNYIEDNRFRKSWEVDLEELKERLHCTEEDTYKEFKRFNDRLLKRVKKEMDEKTDCRYTYEPIKVGRTVTKVKFTVETIADRELNNETPKLPPNPANGYKVTEKYGLWANVFMEGDKDVSEEEWECIFNDEQLKELHSLLCAIPLYKMPKTDYDDNYDIRRYHYVEQIYTRFKRICREKQGTADEIKNPYNYFVKMLESESKE